MAKIKYQGGLTKLIASKIGKKNRNKFLTFIHNNDNFKKTVNQLYKYNDTKIDTDVASFSSSYDFSEQVLSIFSFIKYVGKPISWIIYSDGSHTPLEIDLIENAIPWVKIIKYNLDDESELVKKVKPALLPWFNEFLDYAKHKPLGKKLFYYLNHTIERSTLFTDSDIIFYEKADLLKTHLDKQNAGYYLPDINWGSLDSRYTDNNQPQLYQVNSGFFIVNREIEILSEGLSYLKKYNFEYEYFSEQTIFHALFLNNGFVPLDPRIFIINVDDQFDFSNLCSRSNMAIRHFTGPVRHKMWQKNWKWQLAIS
jgi:hypothetical protein